MASINSIEQFVQNNTQSKDAVEHFQLEHDSMLKVDLNGKVWIRMGSMTAYRGSISFKREGVLEGGLSKLIKKAVSGEGTVLTKAEGRGDLFLSDTNKKITVLHFTNDSLIVNGNDILAFDDSITYDVTMMRKISGMMSGGLFNIKLQGTGYAAITTHGKPLVLQVTPESPVITDPNATVAWSTGLKTDIKTDISIGTFFGRGSGESIQQVFTGNGFVVLQPYEEVYYAATNA